MKAEANKLSIPSGSQRAAKFFILLGKLLLLVLTFAACIQPSVTPLAPTPPTTATAPTEVIDASLTTLVDDSQLQTVVIPARDLPDLSLRLRPEVTQVPLVVNETQPDYAVGEQIVFWVHNTGSASNLQITAELVYKSAVAYAWVDVTGQYNRTALQVSIDRFSTQIYPAVRAVFGSEWTPGVDNDPRLHILHTEAIGPGLAGYFSSADEYSRLVNPFSNEKELFYINLSLLNGASNDGYEQVLAHEFQHMIHWHEDRNEGVWMNEGLSELAQDAGGYTQDLSYVGSFLRQPDVQLNSWNDATANNFSHYGAAYLFVKYLDEHYGSAFIRQLVAAPNNGIEGINQVVSAQTEEGEDGPDFDLIFADWVVANLLDQPQALDGSGRFGYQTIDPGRVQPQEVLVPTAIQQQIGNYASDYFVINTSGNLQINFQGVPTTTLAPLQIYEGANALWSNRADESDMRLTRLIDLRSAPADSPLLLEAAMWWEIEEGYDYGYVLASGDGKKWDILSGTSATANNAAGNSFGIGYTGNSGEWRIEQFDLSPYWGQQIWLRFEYVTDDAVNKRGWWIDNLAIPAIGWQDDFEGDLTGWESEGWVRSDNVLPQRWLVQVLEFVDEQLVNLTRPIVDEAGHIDYNITASGDSHRTILVISGLTPVTTEEAPYLLTLQ